MSNINRGNNIEDAHFEIVGDPILIRELPGMLKSELEAFSNETQLYFLEEYGLRRKPTSKTFFFWLVGFPYMYLDKWGQQLLMTVIQVAAIYLSVFHHEEVYRNAAMGLGSTWALIWIYSFISLGANTMIWNRALALSLMTDFKQTFPQTKAKNQRPKKAETHPLVEEIGRIGYPAD